VAAPQGHVGCPPCFPSLFVTEKNLDLFSVLLFCCISNILDISWFFNDLHLHKVL